MPPDPGRRMAAPAAEVPKLPAMQEPGGDPPELSRLAGPWLGFSPPADLVAIRPSYRT